MYRSSQAILKELTTRKLEDLEVIKHVETYLKKKRGYVISPLSPTAPVILLVSGGLDSIIVWGYLLEELKVPVYPLFLRRGQRRVKYEEAAVEYFDQYYQARHPQLSQPVFKMDAAIPAHQIRFPITIHSNEKTGRGQQWHGIPLYSNFLVSHAVQYARFLEVTQQLHLRTVITSFMPRDGLVMQDETLTAMRVINQTVCALTQDYEWQTLALPLEKELGFFHDKATFVRWATQKGIPLQHTRSCIRWGKHHCGTCISCITRQEAFKRAKVVDQTQYQVDTPILTHFHAKFKTLFSAFLPY